MVLSAGPLGKQTNDICQEEETSYQKCLLQDISGKELPVGNRTHVLETRLLRECHVSHALLWGIR